MTTETREKLDALKYCQKTKNNCIFVFSLLKPKVIISKTGPTADSPRNVTNVCGVQNVIK